MAIEKTSFRNVTILVGSTTLVLVTAGLAPALPGIAAAFQDAPNAGLLVRLTLTMPALLGGIAAPFAGIFLDRWGRKPVIVAALIVYGLAGTAGYVLDSLTGILLSRAVLGLAMAGLANGFVTLLTDYFSGARLHQFTGYLGAFAGFGGVVYQILAGFLAGIGWRYPFLIYLMAFGVLVSVLFTVDEPELRAQPSPQDHPDEQAAVPMRAILMIYAIGLASMVTLFTLIINVPFYLTAQAGANSSQVGLALAFLSLPGAIMALLYSRLKTRLSFQSLGALVFLNLGIGHIVPALTSSYGLIVAGLFVGGLGFGLLLPNLVSWLAPIVPPAIRGRAVGGLNATIFLGQFITPFVTQPVVDRAGLAGTFGLAGGIAILLAVALTGGRLIPSIGPRRM
jgi:MFS family permease